MQRSKCVFLVIKRRFSNLISIGIMSTIQTQMNDPNIGASFHQKKRKVLIEATKCCGHKQSLH